MTGEMTIENVINRSCINLHMKGRDKKEVIEEMAEMFDRAREFGGQSWIY